MYPNYSFSFDVLSDSVTGEFTSLENTLYYMISNQISLRCLRKLHDIILVC